MPDEAWLEPSVDATAANEAAISPGLVLVATPIGNLADLSPRAVAALAAADLVLCEDTRHSARLLQHHGISVRTSPLHDHNEEARTPALLDDMRGGARVVLVSDAGTPLVSDPGFRLPWADSGAAPDRPGPGEEPDVHPAGGTWEDAQVLDVPPAEGPPPHPRPTLHPLAPGTSEVPEPHEDEEQE